MNKPKIEIYSQPPPGLAAQALALVGTLPSVMYTPEIDYFEYATITPTVDLWISSASPITISMGDETNNQIVASWYDPFARPRRIQGYEGSQLSIRVSTSGVVCVWGATQFAGQTPYTP